MSATIDEEVYKDDSDDVSIISEVEEVPIISDVEAVSRTFDVEEVFIISDALDHSPIPSPGSGAQADALNAQQILLWLQSRLATEGGCSDPTFLTVAWWQPILMRILPLKSKSTVVNYRLHLKPSISYPKRAPWWRGISTKNPSADQLNQVCGGYRLVYLRTTDVSNVGELKSSLQRKRYSSERILAMFPFAIDLWEILVAPDYVDQFIECAKACKYVVNEIVRPGTPVEHPSDFRNPFESCLRARERLIARASIAQLAQLTSSDNKLASCAAAVYRDVVELYRCCDAYNTVVGILLATDQPAYSPEWSCIVGGSHYNARNICLASSRWRGNQKKSLPRENWWGEKTASLQCDTPS